MGSCRILHPLDDGKILVWFGSADSGYDNLEEGWKMIEVHQVYYGMELRGGGDIWRIHGRVYGHPRFKDGDAYSPSGPVAFDEATMVVTSFSGKQYKICSFASHQKPEVFIAQLKKDIENGYFEVH